MCLYRGISENRILLVAAGVTFYALLAIFPGIAALISIYGLFADPAGVANHLDTIASVAMRSTLFTEKRKSVAFSNSMPLRCL